MVFVPAATVVAEIPRKPLPPRPDGLSAVSEEVRAGDALTSDPPTHLPGHGHTFLATEVCPWTGLSFLT